MPPAIRLLRSEAEIAACFPLMRELRPHLASPAEFIARWRRQARQGYRLAALFAGTQAMALAGFRVQDNLVHGRFLYVDDLVTSEASRRAGHGALLMAWLAHTARARGCGRLVLDTPLNNVLGHRFYYRHGLVATALRFMMPVE